jgi:hypothetical protein
MASEHEVIKKLRAATAAAERADKKRSELAVEARREGYPWPVIAGGLNLSINGAERYVKRANGGVLPKPKQYEV